MVTHGVILSNVADQLIILLEVTTRFAHQAVSAPAIKTNPFAAIPHL
jgi:hypothetical protein